MPPHFAEQWPALPLAENFVTETMRLIGSIDTELTVREQVLREEAQIYGQYVR